MTKSRREPRPVPVRRYRYSKWRWRVLVRALDAVGAVVMAAWRRLRPARRPTTPQRILVVQLDHLGDAVLSSPLFPRLRSAFPEATIDVLASPSNRDVFEADPHIDRVRLAERNWFARRGDGYALGTAVWTLGRRLRDGGYDVGIDVRGDVLTVLTLALAGIPRRVGWAMGGGGFLLTDVAPWVPGRHEVAARLALLEPLGIPSQDDPAAPARMHVHVSDTDRARVAQQLREAWPARPPGRSGGARVGLHARAAPLASLATATPPTGRRRLAIPRPPSSPWDADWLHAGRFGDEAPLVAVHLGAGTAAKRWPVRHWRTLIARFLADGWRVVVVGGAEDVDLAAALEPRPHLVDWTGRLALTETVALLERADLFVGADSGPAHLAASVGLTSIILFSGTNQVRQWRPWSRRALVLRHRVGCRPCHQKVCPLADHPCMTDLSPDRVYRAARRWWARVHRQEAPHAPL